MTAVNVITNCLTYTGDAADSCDECKVGYYNFSSKACCKHGELIITPETSSANC